MNDRRGVMSLPIKLTITFIIIGLALPPVAAMVGELEDGRDLTLLQDSCQDLTDAMTRVYYQGTGTVTTVFIEVPHGGSLTVGGPVPDAYSVGLYQDGVELGREYLNNYGVLSTEPLPIYGDMYLRMWAESVDGTIWVKVAYDD